MTKIQKIFSHAFEHRLWRILPVPGSRDLAFEVRDEANSVIWFYKYHAPAGLIRIHPEDMPWWSTLISAGPEVFLTRSYGAEGDAGKIQLRAYHGSSGKFLWETEGDELRQTGSTRISVMRGGEEVWLDAASGKPVERELIPEEHENKNDSFPFRYMEGSDYFESIAVFLLKQTDKRPVQAVDYLETGELMIISAFFEGQNGLRNLLLIYDFDGNPLLEAELGDNLKGISDNTFFIYHGNLIFVTSRNDFFEYSLA